MSISFREVAFAGVLEGALEKVLPEATEKQVTIRTAVPRDEELVLAARR